MFFKQQKEIIVKEIIKEKDYSIEELEEKLLEKYDLNDCKFDTKFENEIIEELKTVNNLHHYLQILINKDIIRYFPAQDDNQRNLIRGAFVRTLYIKNKLKATKKLDIKRKK